MVMGGLKEKIRYHLSNPHFRRGAADGVFLGSVLGNVMFIIAIHLISAGCR